MEKPKILSDEEIRMSCLGEGTYWIGEKCETATDTEPVLMPQFHRVAQAQLDADVGYYEPLIQQAKAEVAREIFEEIELELVTWGGFSQQTQHQAAIINKNWWQSLKTKYGGQKK